MLAKSYEVQLTELDQIVFAQLVGEDHYLRRVKKAIDFSFIYEVVASCYSETMGRPADDPVLLLKLIFLQFTYDLSDRNVMAQAQVNVAFRYFLDLPLSARLPHPTTLSDFRGYLGPQRFDEIFARVLGQARVHELVKDRLRLKDATHVIANVATPTTMALVAQMRTRLLACLQEFVPEQVAAARAEADAIRQRTSDLKDEQRLLARVTHLRQVLLLAEQVLSAQMIRLEQEAEAKADLERQVRALGAAVALARKVLSDREPGASDRVVSLVDGEVRRGKHGEFFTGYLTDILVDPDSELITAIEVIAANGDEAAHAEALIRSEQQAQGNQIEAVSMDRAGYRGDVLERLIDAEDGLHTQVYVPPYDRNRAATQHYGAEQFSVDEQRGVLRCPAGQETDRSSRDTKRKGRIYRFTAAQCRACPLRGACLGPGERTKGRQVFKSDWEKQYERAKEVARTEQYQQVRRMHGRVERKLSDLIRNHAGRRVRYRGLARVQVQYVMGALAANIKRMVNHLFPSLESALDAV